MSTRPSSVEATCSECHHRRRKSKNSIGLVGASDSRTMSASVVRGPRTYPMKMLCSPSVSVDLIACPQSINAFASVHQMIMSLAWLFISISCNTCMRLELKVVVSRLWRSSLSSHRTRVPSSSRFLFSLLLSFSINDSGCFRARLDSGFHSSQPRLSHRCRGHWSLVTPQRNDRRDRL